MSRVPKDRNTVSTFIVSELLVFFCFVFSVTPLKYETVSSRLSKSKTNKRYNRLNPQPLSDLGEM